MNKKIITIMLALVIAMANLATTAFAWEYKYSGSDPIDEISVSLDGRLIDFDVPPQIINDRTMVPVRAIFDAIGMTVEWNEDYKIVTAYYPETDIIINMQIDNPIVEAYFGGDDFIYYEIDAPATIIDGRTLVPLRALSEVLGCKVVWEPDIKYVHIATLHRDNYSPALVQPSKMVSDAYLCEAVCDDHGRRSIKIYATEETVGENVFIATENGEYLFFGSGDNLQAIETEDGIIYSIDYIPFPDTYTIYCYPTENGEVVGFRTRIDLDWNRR